LEAVSDGIAMLKVAEDTKITLERGEQVVPVPSAMVPCVIVGRAPSTPRLIRRDVDVKVVIRVGRVARAAPHCPASLPWMSGGGKVAAEEAVHLLTHQPTLAALAGPSPEGLGKV